MTGIWRAGQAAALSICLLLQVTGCGSEGENGGAACEGPADSMVTVVDGMGREVTVPFDPEYVICSGPGCLRLLVYLQAQDRIASVDDMEGGRPEFDARPYALANPWFRGMPVFGEFRGRDNPELIVMLDPQPQVIFKTYPLMGMDPLELENKTGIPVVVLNYGNLSSGRGDLYNSLRTMGSVMNRSDRAEEVIDFLEETIADLQERTSDIPMGEKPTCFVGGIAYRGPHGFQSTEPGYPPFMFAGAENVAFLEDGRGEPMEHADVAREQIVEWDPDVIFVDASTMETDPRASAIYQLQTDPAYASLSAVRSGEIYCLLPYNWYTKNFGSILADAYFVGKVLYPDRFDDVDPSARADEIYLFLVGEEVFTQLRESFGNMVFERLIL